jgi:DNA gyrase subunit B
MAEYAAWNEPGDDDPLIHQARKMTSHIRRRPGMYIGGTGPGELQFLANELLEYGLAAISSGNGKSLHVRIHADGSLTVADDGRGIPVETYGTAPLTTLEWVLTCSTGVEAHGVDRVFRTSLHGVGARAVTALSDWAEATVCRSGRVYRQRYERGLAVGDVCDTGPAGTRTGTEITFHPDPEIFGDAAFDRDCLEARLRELAFLNKRLAITLVDERSGKQERFKYDGGIAEFVEYLNQADQTLHKPIYIEKWVDDVHVEVALQYTTSDEQRVRCYANNAYNSIGGTHLSGLRTALTRTLNAYGRKENLFKNNLRPTGKDFREGLTAVVSVQLPEPQLESQTKIRLNNPEVEGIVASAVRKEFTKFLKENPVEAQRIVQKAVAAAKLRKAKSAFKGRESSGPAQ